MDVKSTSARRAYERRQTDLLVLLYVICAGGVGSFGTEVVCRWQEVSPGATWRSLQEVGWKRVHVCDATTTPDPRVWEKDAHMQPFSRAFAVCSPRSCGRGIIGPNLGPAISFSFDIGACLQSTSTTFYHYFSSIFNINSNSFQWRSLH